MNNQKTGFIAQWAEDNSMQITTEKNIYFFSTFFADINKLKGYVFALWRENFAAPTSTVRSLDTSESGLHREGTAQKLELQRSHDPRKSKASVELNSIRVS